MNFKLQELLDYLQTSGLDIQIKSQQSDLQTNVNSLQFSGLSTLESANDSQISFLANPKYASDLADSDAGAIFIKESHAAHCKHLALVTDNPYLAYAKASQFMRERLGDIIDVEVGVHPTAIIAEGVELGANVAIGPYVVVGAECKIDEGAQIGAHTVIGKRVHIGSNTKVSSLVSIYDDVKIGQRCRVYSQATLGSDGFGYAPSPKGWEQIAQLGGVVIHDDVHIGASASVDRGALNPTVVHRGVILDNYVMIAHNAIIGEYTAMAGKSGVAGSTKVGARCIVGGQAGISGHLNIADDVQVGMQAQVTNSIDEPGQYASGTGLYTVKKWRRLVVRLRQLIK